MNKIQFAKNVVTTVVGVGTAKIVSSIISNNTNQENVVDKVTMTSASLVLGAMVADVTKRYTDAKIDEIATFVNENFKK